MSEMTSVVEQQHTQQQQQQYVAGGAESVGVPSDKQIFCKKCGMNFDSSTSLGVHLRYQHQNLASQWTTQASQQEESNNNNSKAGNHNNGSSVPLKCDNISAAADSSESSSRPASDGPASSSVRLQHHQQQPHSQESQHPQQFNHHFGAPMFNETQYYMHNETPYILQPPQQHYSPDRPDEADSSQRGAMGYARYHPYQHAQHFASTNNSVSSTSPRSPLQCDKCGAVYEDTSQLTEHVRSSHPSSPVANSYPSAQTQQQPPPPQQQPTPQYQQLAGSPQQNQAQTQQQQMHASPPHNTTNQHSQQQPSSFDFTSAVVKSETKQEPEEQAEILDLDSHKVQTHRYDEEYLRLQQQQHQQEMHLQIQHQVMQQHQSRGSTHSVTSMLSWPPAGSQPHDYHSGLSPMGHVENASPIQEQQNQFMRNQVPPQSQQHMAPIESPHHSGSPIITSTQSMPGHAMPTGLIQQNPKPPPLGNQSWKSNEARRPKTYNCTACNKWFTSSGHLKRHYNTTLHKNAVKQSNQPDPANMPISAHHHPGRDANSRGASAANRNSPELSSSSSPPNLMAGPSGEATRGLLHTPTTSNISNTIIFSSNSSSSNSSEATSVQTPLGQKVLEQQQHLQAQPSTVMLASNLMYLGSPVSSPIAQAQHHHQQMDSSSPQLGPQQPPQQQHQQQQSHNLPMSSPSQIGSSHHPMNSPMSPMQQHPGHMNSPSPMGSHHHHLHHHHMNSPSPIMAGVAPSAMASPTPGSMMGGTTMPHQPYPNALPPHVTTITSIPVLVESITNQLTTTGNSDMHSMLPTHQQVQRQEMLPSFGTIGNHQQHHQHKLLPDFTQFNGIANGFIVGQNQIQVSNVGGLNPEENIPPQERSFESPVANYNIYRNSPPQYECLGGMEMMQTTDEPIIISAFSELRNHQLQLQQQQQQMQETNNNLPQLTQKEELNPNIINKRMSNKEDKNKKNMTKEHQVTSTNTGSHYISENGLHKCIECDKVFNKACYLTQHNKSFHSGDKPFKCNQCGKRFPLEYLHAEHLQKHAGDKPYKCEICPKQFNHKTDLRRHMCLHTGEKPYACDNCGKGFIRKDHMMKHLETHKRKSNIHHKVHLRA